MSKVQNMHAQQCTEPQQQALREWTYPMWFPPSACKVAEHFMPRPTEHHTPISPEHQLSRSPECPAPSVPKCPLPRFPKQPPPHANSWQAHHELEICLDMPKYRDQPEYWAEWIDQNPTCCSQGIRVKPDGHMSLHSDTHFITLDMYI